jgi:hypothetical protein
MSTVEAYDPATDSWTRKADMPKVNELLSTSVVGGKIYAIGGQREEGAIRDVYRTVDMYDPATDTWTKRADAPLPRKVHSACVLNDIIYVFGGRNVIGGWPQSTLFQYDPAADAWTAREEMPYEVGTAAVSTVEGRIYLIGGSSTWPPNQVISTVWEYIPSPDFDFNGDGIVDAQDMSMMVDHWHTDAARYDLAPSPGGDGIVDVQDLVALSEHLFEDYRLDAHWKLDESEGDVAYDSAGLNDATLIGNPLWLPDSGHVDGALQFDGIDDAVVSDSDPVLNPANGPFSVFVWIQGGAPGQVILSQINTTNWLVDNAVQGGLLTELTREGAGGRSAPGAVPLPSQTVVTDGDWHHVGLTWDGAYRKLYVDSELVASDNAEQISPLSSNSGIYIGAGKNLAAGSFWSGLIDDVRIYDRAITP